MKLRIIKNIKLNKKDLMDSSKNKLGQNFSATIKRMRSNLITLANVTSHENPEILTTYFVIYNFYLYQNPIFRLIKNIFNFYRATFIINYDFLFLVILYFA